MKNTTTIIFFLVLVFASLNAKAQGNLQFNRAVTELIVDQQTSTVSPVKYDTLVVDSGKVLKITSAHTNWDDYTNYNRMSIKLNYIQLAPQYNTQYSDARGQKFSPQMPIWLPEGTYIIESSGGGRYGEIKCTISGIEFNVVQ